MTRVWDSHTVSPLGQAKLHTLARARGPSADLAAFNVSLVSTWGLGINGRTWVGRQSFDSESWTTYT